MAIQCVGENPFRDCADPGSAIPSAACDRALAALEQAIVAQRNPIVLLGPAGAGKTLLLRRIFERPPPFIRTVFLPWLNVPGEDLIPWIRAFEGTEGSEDDFVAAARAFHARGLRTLLLVDEAQSIPRDSAEGLAELVGRAERAVQVILAGMDGRSLQAAVAAFQGGAEYVELAGEVTPHEVGTWVHNTFNADQLLLLEDLDWAELVRKAKGVPRLVRWELERRLATGDLAAALGRETAGPRGGRVGPTPTAKSEEVVVLPTARTSPQAAVAARSTLLMRRDVVVQQWATILGRSTDGFRRFALWSREVCKEAGRASRRHARLLGHALGQPKNQIRDAIPSRTENLGGLVIDRAEGFAARRTAALRNARVWSADYSTRLVRTGRRGGPAITEVMRRIKALLQRVVFGAWHLTERLTLAAARFATQALAALRGAVKRGEERVAELARAKALAFPSRRPGPKRADTHLRMPASRAGPLTVLAIVAAMAFLLGRVTARPIAGTGPREFTPRKSPIVPSGLPAAPPQVGQDQAVAPPFRAGADGAHKRAPEANPLPPVPPPAPHPENAVRTTPVAPKHILVKIDAHPRARIWIDGHDVGRTPLVRLPLAPGRHNFQVLFADGRRIHRTLEIRHGTHVVKFS